MRVDERASHDVGGPAEDAARCDAAGQCQGQGEPRDDVLLRADGGTFSRALRNLGNMKLFFLQLAASERYTARVLRPHITCGRPEYSGCTPNAARVLPIYA